MTKRMLGLLSDYLGHTLHRFQSNQFALLQQQHPIANAQTFPILRSTHCTLEFKQAASLLNHLKHTAVHYQAILVQSHWDVPATDLAPIINPIRQYQPDTKIVFLDWYAPLHIPQPDLLNLVDLYVKKQVLKDRQRYSGLYDTNLLEYEAQWNEAFKQTRYLQLDPALLDQKLFVGWNFATDGHKIRQLNQSYYLNLHRPIDIHCRICAPSNRDQWYGHMRGRAYDAVQAFKQAHPTLNILSETVRIEYQKYINEIVHSKICISPFGYGEVCWRDFEAILSGALLIKPDMGHLVTNPDIYCPYETYVPCQWDFADLDSQCMYYLQNEPGRQQIVSNAVLAWKAFLQQGWPDLWSQLMHRLAIEPIPVQSLEKP